MIEPARLVFQEPQHRLLTFVGLSLIFGSAIAFVFGLSAGARGLYAGLVVGPFLGFLMSLPKRWELQGDEFHQVYPKREAGQVQLSEARSLEVKLQVKGQVDLWVLPARGHRVAIPTEPGGRADVFRHHEFRRLPPEVLTRAQDPLIVELVAAAERAASSDAG